MVGTCLFFCVFICLGALNESPHVEYDLDDEDEAFLNNLRLRYPHISLSEDQFESLIDLFEEQRVKFSVEKPPPPSPLLLFSLFSKSF